MLQVFLVNRLRIGSHVKKAGTTLSLDQFKLISSILFAYWFRKGHGNNDSQSDTKERFFEKRGVRLENVCFFFFKQSPVGVAAVFTFSDVRMLGLELLPASFNQQEMG